MKLVNMYELKFGGLIRVVNHDDMVLFKEDM